MRSSRQASGFLDFGRSIFTQAAGLATVSFFPSRFLAEQCLSTFCLVWTVAIHWMSVSGGLLCSLTFMPVILQSQAVLRAGPTKDYLDAGTGDRPMARRTSSTTSHPPASQIRVWTNDGEGLDKRRAVDCFPLLAQLGSPSLSHLFCLSFSPSFLPPRDIALELYTLPFCLSFLLIWCLV